jgi:cytosine/adenosine deaminase-related metal-dependent hydrolase/SAM-dependent methyltransferase
MPSSAKNPVLRSNRPQKQKFALWSRAYDNCPNPMLSVEERFLSPLLPEFRGRDLLDVGCGTGRWLERLATSAAHSLTGIDYSPEMLDRASQKLGRRALLMLGDATTLPVSNNFADVVLASFVASYVDDVSQLAAELRRVVRPNGKVYVSDVHPETAAACQWKRGFPDGGQHVELHSTARSLDQVISSFMAAGLELACLLEPPFGKPELEICRSAGKLEAFGAAGSLPAVYILQLRPSVRLPFRGNARPRETRLGLLGTRIALDGETSIDGNVEIQAGRIASITTSQHVRASAETTQSGSVDLSGYLLLPGLINAHDHLEFSLYPNLGRGPYISCEGWASDIHLNDSKVIARHQSVPKDVRLWWGAIRNLLCGVTTVCHHNPLQPELTDPEFPLNVVKNFGWAHSLTVDPQMAAAFQATPADAPFITHACEGLDEAAADEIFDLDRIGVLEERTVLIHGLALTPDGIALLNKRGATVVWCPTSNRFLFDRTHSRETITSLRQVLLGSDSPLTSSGDLLDEVHFAHREAGVAANEVYRMVFDRAAHVFPLNDGQGTIRPDAIADLIAVRDRGFAPAETLVGMKAADVELVIVGGRVQVACDTLARRLPKEATAGLVPLEVDSTLRWVRAPLGRLFREAERVLGCGIKIGGKKVRHVCSTWL